MMFSNDNVNWYNIELYNNSFGWKLADGEGSKTVYARFRDRDGNWGNVVSDDIELSGLGQMSIFGRIAAFFTGKSFGTCWRQAAHFH